MHIVHKNSGCGGGGRGRGRGSSTSSSITFSVTKLSSEELNVKRAIVKKFQHLENFVFE